MVLTGRDCAAPRGIEALGEYADAVGKCARGQGALSRQRVSDACKRDPACHRARFPRAMGDDVGLYEEGEVRQKAFQANALPAVRRRGTSIVSFTPPSPSVGMLTPHGF